MKRIILITLLSFILFSCESKDSIKEDITQLEARRTEIQNQVNELDAIKRNRNREIDELSSQLTTLHIYKQGRTPKYILKLKLKQSHFSLSISKHIKDSMNAIEFELPVDKEFYDNVTVGSEVVDRFRVGSLLFNTSFGSWKMTVVDKRIN